MKKLALVTAALAINLLSLPAYAQGGLILGKPGYGGTGCPGGTASVSLGGGGKSLTVSFSRYLAMADGRTGKTLDRKFCGLSIPVNVPAGVSVSILSMTFSGTNALPAGTKADFRFESFFTGGQGPVFTKSFTGPLQGSFSVKQSVAVGSTVWSSCGADVILRTNSSLIARSTPGQKASSSIGSQQLRTAVVYTLQSRSC